MTSQPKSRWGSFLQQAVAGVESRLDTILADNDSEPSAEVRPASSDLHGAPDTKSINSQRSVTSTSTRSSEDIKRQPISKGNARLQERLAKAVISRSASKSGQSSSHTSQSNSPRRSLDVIQDGAEPRSTAGPDAAKEDTLAAGGHVKSSEEDLPEAETGPGSDPSNGKQRNGVRKADLSSQPSSLGGNSSEEGVANGAADSIAQEELGSTEVSTRSGILPAKGNAPETAPLPPQPHEADGREDEMLDYVEQIDALQAKLQFLTREAAEIAKGAIQAASPGSMEETIALKDEKIALLLEEGQKLSHIELKNMNTIRKLRLKLAEDDKRVNSSSRSAEEATKAMRLFQDRAKRAEASQREEQARVRALVKVQKDLETLKIDDISKTSQIQDLQRRVTEAEGISAAKEAREISASLERERQCVEELREELAKRKNEHELSEERYRRQIQELQTHLTRAMERARLDDLDLRREIAVLEGKLEAFQVQAEEVSTGATSNTQAKLLRQIETLQTQYSVASENWRGIEASLLTRNASLEKERDELQTKDAEMRRKARENLSKMRQTEESLERATSQRQDLEDEATELQAKCAGLEEALQRAHAALSLAQKELKSQKKHWEEKLSVLEAEKSKPLLPVLTTSLSQPRVDSPLISGHKSSTVGRGSPHGRRNPASFGLGLAGTQLPVSDRPPLRRDSSQVSYESATPSRPDRGVTPSQMSVNQDPPDAAYLNADQQEDAFEGFLSPATPERTINDMLSVSTSAAGPSIQVVERMSAAVRRLESEKAASKDELARLSDQRDEARKQIIVLMKEADAKHAAEERVATLEAEVEAINQRYQTTLEMLGEKSELVEELRADVADVKQMYRDLVENTMK